MVALVQAFLRHFRGQRYRFFSERSESNAFSVQKTKKHKTRVPSCKSGRYVLLLQSDLKSVFFVVYYGFQPIFNQVGAPTRDLSSLGASFEEIRAKRRFLFVSLQPYSFVACRNFHSVAESLPFDWEGACENLRKGKKQFSMLCS